jgi:hypothetical protein
VQSRHGAGVRPQNIPAALQRDLKFQDRVVAETRALLAKAQQSGDGQVWRTQFQ